MKKERHGFLTFWLIFGIVMNVIFMLSCALALDSQDILRAMELSRGVVFICVVLYFIGCVCNVLVLNWKISGFYLYCITSIISCIIDPRTSTIILAIFGPLLDFVFLQLKKNDISAWTHLTGNYSNVSNMDFNENQDEYKKCPFCAENIKKDAVVCRFCQRTLNQTEIANQSGK